MPGVKLGLRAKAFAEQYIDLTTLEADEVLLIRSSNVMQTERVISQLRSSLPQSRIILLVQNEFLGKFKVDEEVVYPFAGNFKLTAESEAFFNAFVQRKYALVLIMYHDFPRRKYEEVEKCALSCGGKITGGVFPDGLVIEVEKDITRKRAIALKLHERLVRKIEALT